MTERNPQGNNLENSYGPETVHSPSHGPELAYYQYMPNAAPEVSPDQNGFYAPIFDKEKSLAPYSGPTGGRKKKLILGIPLLWFLAIVGILVLALALGLGLGLGLKKSSDTGSAASSSDGDAASITSSLIPSTTTPSQQTTTTAPSSSSITSDSTSTSSDKKTTSSRTSTAPVTSGTMGVADNSCTSTSPKTYFNGNQRFTEYCATDWPNGVAAFDGDGTVSDLASAIAYTFESCMNLCLEYNSGLTSGLCNAVTYQSNLTLAIPSQGANCWLKDKRGVDRSAEASSACAVRIP